MGHGAPTGFHEGPLQKLWGILVFLRGRLWNSTGGNSVQDADLTNPIKTLLIQKYIQKPCENDHFHGVVPAHGDTAAERTTVHTFGTRTAR